MGRNGIFIDTVTPMNLAYQNMHRAYREGDFRAEYLRQFEAAVSPNLPRPITLFVPYVRFSNVYHLPNHGKIRSDYYHWYMMLYEHILRTTRLNCREPEEESYREFDAAFRETEDAAHSYCGRGEMACT